MLDYFFGAIALMFVFEGILPFLCPECWRQWMTRMMASSDQTMRVVGLGMMIFGVILLYFVNLFLGD